MDREKGRMGRTGSRRRLASLFRFGTAVVLGGWLLSAGFPLSGQGACVPWSAEGMACYVRVPEGFGRKPDSFQRQPEDPGTGKRYVNPDTGWQVVVEDRANLLEPEQIQELSRIMEPVTAYGHAAFVTIFQNTDSTEQFARSYYHDRFGADSGTIFVIDINRRNVWIHSDGAVWQVITTANANTVADNVYRYASKGDYYQCGAEAFRQILALLEGKRIPRPMKYISNAFLALILALLANYGLVIWSARLHKPGEKALLASIDRKFAYRNLQASHTSQTRTYDPASGGGGHHGGRGGGGGGGGRSGGGGGHRF